MKHNLILLIMLYAIAGNITAQDSKTYLVAEGKQWAVCVNTFKGEYWTETYRLQGDTVISGKTYKIEHISRYEDLSDMKPSGRYIREENGKVYSTTDKDQRNDFVFDYAMEIGDTLCYNPGIDYYGNVHKHFQCIRLVAVRDTVMPNGDGLVRKCYDVEEGFFDSGDCQFTGVTYSCIEDIGFEYWGLSTPQIGIDGSWSYLLYVKQDNTMLYQSFDKVLWKDNTALEYIKYDRIDAPYYDLMGRKVANPTRGIYIKDGKKVAIK